MGQLRGLIDTNVLVAAATAGHLHCEPSLECLESMPLKGLATSLHCLSEFYNIATRNIQRGGSGMTPQAAVDAMENYRENLEVLGLSANQHIDAIRKFAATGRIGAQIYDYLIGHVAVVHRVPAIITWNVKHMAPLFPASDVVTPAQFAAAI